MNVHTARTAHAEHTVPATMTAWAQRGYGGPETVAPTELPVPRPKSGEALVRVRATGLNAADARIMRGDPALLRLGFGLTRPRQSVRGIDIAGTVVSIGSAVTGVAVGDEVVAESIGGGLASVVAVPVSRLVRRPAEVSAEHAAALPIAGGTAMQALDRAAVAAGHRVLVIGAGGGVGTFTVQLAKLRGAETWAMCGARARALVERLGASRTLDYRQTVPGALPLNSFDAVIDIAGVAPLRVLHDLLVPGGTLVMVAGDGSPVLGPIPRMLRAALLRTRERRRLRPLAATAKPELLRELVALVQRGSLEPVIERAYDFAEARDALTRIDSGHVVGKIVVRAVADDERAQHDE